MRAIRCGQLGGPEVLTPVETAAPTPGPGQVTIDVAYAGVNFADVQARATGYRVQALPFIPGLDVSGHIRVLGDGVTGLAPGAPVAAFAPAAGGYAEVVAVPAAGVFALPDGVDLRTAAALPTVLPTAWALIHDVGRLRPGETVLVQAAAGGVGAVVGQLAKLAGAGAVYGVVSSDAKSGFVREHGYDDAFLVDTFDGDLRRVTERRGIDLVLDSVGGKVLRRGLDSLARFGRLVSFGNASNEAPWQASAADLYARGLTVSGFSLLGLAASDPAALRELAHRAFAAVAEGAVSVPITAEYPLADAAAAHTALGGRATTGKLLLRVRD